MPLSPLTPPDEIVLCATARLVRTLPLEAAAQAGVGEGGVAVPRTATIAQWLTEVIEEALLCGEFDPASLPRRVLSAQAERLLWLRCVRAGVGEDAAAALFDVRGLAAEAMHAATLVDTWGLDIDPTQASPEVQRFSQWRAAFVSECSRRGWVTATMLMRRQVAWLASGVGRLPARVALAGFDHFNPLEAQLIQVLEQRGVKVREQITGTVVAAVPRRVALADASAECRAAVHWATTMRAARPEARIGIAVPDLAARRTLITRLLDHTLDIAAVQPAQAQRQRHYNVSLGVPLAQVPMVATALDLLRLAAAGEFAQHEASTLFNRPWWAGDMSGADIRARFDAMMRARLPARTTLARIQRLARKAITEGLPANVLADGLAQVQRVLDRLPARALPSVWAGGLTRVLDAFAWPGERSLSSHDFQAREAFEAALDELASLDDISGALSFGEALTQLAEICAGQLFQPRTEGRPAVQVLGLLEAAGERFDALWVMGMNDTLWPPSPRPSPLLPPALQRAVGMPHASPEVQLAFAQAIHRRLLQAAPEPVFSHAQREGDAELRASPLLAGIPAETAALPLAALLGERLRAATPPDALVMLQDHRAPAIVDGDKVAGGTGLFRSQAICPAWAFYGYRLGAQALESPVEGLDARDRGSLVHQVLECFWRGRDLAGVVAMAGAALDAAIATAVDRALAHFVAAREAPLSPRLLQLERQRLVDLLGGWLSLERQRTQPFTVHACETVRLVEVGGITVRLVVDRIDALDDGRLLMIDYKTSASVDDASWSATRITEPQLPIYACFAGDEHPPAGIALAQVRLDKCRFVGITEDPGVLPGVKDLAHSRSKYDEAMAPDWPSLLDRWRRALIDLADEIKAGEAAVRFTREKDLAWCEVLPILRLPERRMLYQRLLADANLGEHA